MGLQHSAAAICKVCSLFVEDIEWIVPGEGWPLAGWSHS
jgi:hypothetical protein